MLRKKINCEGLEFLRKTPFMEFTLVKVQAYSAHTATLLQKKFTTEPFWNTFQKLAVLKNYFSERSIW